MSETAVLPRGDTKIHIVQGEYHVSSDASSVISTLLGSCVAACLRDPAARVGGMNHFLLPGEKRPGHAGNESLRYGVHAMELLINELLRSGAQRSRLEAKLFGGGRMMQSSHDIGATNAAFAERFLQAEGIPIVGGSLRGDRGRRIQFWPVSGRARQIVLAATEVSMFRAEIRPQPSALPTEGTVELF